MPETVRRWPEAAAHLEPADPTGVFSTSALVQLLAAPSPCMSKQKKSHPAHDPDSTPEPARFARAMGRSLRLAAVGSASAALLAVATLAWAAADAVRFFAEVVEHRGGNSEDLAHLLGTLDLILIATTLLIVAAGVWELFVSDITLPDWLEVRSLTELKTKVVDSLILVLAVNFLEHLVGNERPLDLLWRGLATASVGVLLVAFGVAKNR